MQGFPLRFLFFSILMTTAASTAHAQLEAPCAQDSPERHGLFGCSVIENKPLPESLKGPLFWHIDRFSSSDEAKAGIGPTSVAFAAHGSWWLVTIGPKSKDHHGGRHVEQVRLPPLPPAKSYSMLVTSAYIPSGLISRIHTNSGVEVFMSSLGRSVWKRRSEPSRCRKA